MSESPRGIGHILAPWPFILFVTAAAVGLALACPAFGGARGILIAFDVAAVMFFLTTVPMFRHEAEQMRRSAQNNDANRVLLLLISAAVTAVIMVAVAGILMQPGRPKPVDSALVVATLILSWLFSNLVYTLHYARIFYTTKPEGGDCGGVEIAAPTSPIIGTSPISLPALA